MVRLYFYVEGYTEAGFVSQVLRPHLALHGVLVMGAKLVSTGRRHGQIKGRGGGRHYLPAKNELRRLLKAESSPDVRYTTMFDLYALFRDFPGSDEAAAHQQPYERVQALEKFFAADVADWRFIPYLQLHEYEAILFCQPEVFGLLYDQASRGIAQLQEIAAAVASPELIDDGEQTAPSKRISAAFPRYALNKVADGVAAAKLIPLSSVRSKCPHFDQWLTALEGLRDSTPD